MIFKDRVDAGKKLGKIITKEKITNAIVVSLLRGGVVVGQEISKKLKILHLPLAVAKIPAPFQSELAIGALCFDFVFLEPQIVDSLNIDKITIKKQISLAKNKFNSYLKKFKLRKNVYKLKNKTIILVDDGIATGSTIKASLLFLKSLKPKKILVAVPVSLTKFNISKIADSIILYNNDNFSSVSQFYRNFPQVEDEEIKRLLY